MDRETALRALGAGDSASAADLAQTYAARKSELAQRIDAAPTPALREKFIDQAKLVIEAAAVLGLLEVKPAEAAPAEAALEGLVENLPRLRKSGAGSPAAGGEQVRSLGRSTRQDKVTDSPAGPYHRAQDPKTDLEISQCRLDPNASPADVEVFLDRARESSEWIPANLGGVLAVSELPGRVHFNAEALSGRTLRAELDEARRVRRFASVEASVAEIIALAHALTPAEGRFTHGDIRPETLWRDTGGGLRLLGFSLRPDTLEAGRALDARGLAEVLWEMLTGRAPATPLGDVSARRPETPPQIGVALARALSPSGSGFADAAAFAAALSGEMHRRWAPAWIEGPVRRIGLSRLALGAGVVVVGLALMATYPLWKSGTPWQSGADKAEATRLSGIVHVLAARADEQTASLHQQASEDARDAEALNEKLEGGQPGGHGLGPYRRYIEAALKSAESKAVWGGYQARTAPQMSEAQVALADASSMLSLGEERDARAKFLRLDQLYTAITETPNRLRQDRLASEHALEKRMDGAWTDEDCATPSHWIVDDASLHGDWPGVGRFEEQVIGADAGVLYTVSTVPENHAGSLFTYSFDGAALIVRELPTNSVRMRLKKC